MLDTRIQRCMIISTQALWDSEGTNKNKVWQKNREKSSYLWLKGFHWSHTSLRGQRLWCHVWPHKIVVKYWLPYNFSPVTSLFSANLPQSFCTLEINIIISTNLSLFTNILSSTNLLLGPCNGLNCVTVPHPPTHTQIHMLKSQKIALCGIGLSQM